MNLGSSFNRVITDFSQLSELVTFYYQSNGSVASDSEFIGIWDSYAKLREELIAFDKGLFSKLREIPIPEGSVNSVSMQTYYNRNDILPLSNELTKGISYIRLYAKTKTNKTKKATSDYAINLITSRFGKVIRQLRNRHDERPTIAIEDEYDMQDLFHSLLYLFFDDIRAEEWTPSYAGGCSRMDFLLKSEKVAIELKKTRSTLKAKQLGEQLIIDIEKYKQHPDCSKLICFVYDPDSWISNPNGIENDLSQTTEEFQVKVIIEPK